MSDLAARFTQAQQDVTALAEHPDDQDLVRLHALI